MNTVILSFSFKIFSYHDDWLSWHYHLFVGLKDYFEDKKINILEIGTASGAFTNFISKVYDDHQITTISLGENEIPLSEFGGDEERKRKFLELRNKNLNRKNINFVKSNSINIKKYFYGKKFDLIWVDGDHLNPQVTIDIVNSLDLLNNDGIICTDDVIMDNKFEKNKYTSNEGFLTFELYKLVCDTTEITYTCFNDSTAISSVSNSFKNLI